VFQSPFHSTTLLFLKDSLQDLHLATQFLRSAQFLFIEVLNVKIGFILEDQ